MHWIELRFKVSYCCRGVNTQAIESTIIIKYAVPIIQHSSANLFIFDNVKWALVLVVTAY